MIRAQQVQYAIEINFYALSISYLGVLSVHPLAGSVGEAVKALELASIVQTNDGMLIYQQEQQALNMRLVPIAKLQRRAKGIVHPLSVRSSHLVLVNVNAAYVRLLHMPLLYRP
jgi:hypothetical protein